jgi:ubiquitin-like-conjugating enzyme ATG3
MALKQRIYDSYKSTAERFMAVRTNSAFKEKGVLSVSEFVIAGDNLVSKCPTWSWSEPY